MKGLTDLEELERQVSSIMSSAQDSKGKKVWVCDKCSYSCKNANNVRKHVERRHLAFHISCQFCARVFSCRHDLNQHCRIHHNVLN